MRVAVTGSNGQLGHDVLNVLLARNIDCIGIDREVLDITVESQVGQWFAKEKPSVLIHCAAYTAVDRAESEPEYCNEVNVAATKTMAILCATFDIPMLYVSTDYVFPGNGQDCFETISPTGPLNVYGRSKLQGEQMILAHLQKYFIVRTSWVFGVHGGNFVKSMLKAGGEKETVTVVCDQIGSPTYSADLATLLCDMIMTSRFGIYHATNEGFCSWAEFAREIFTQAELHVEVKDITSQDYQTAALRPQNSRLSKKSLDDAGFFRLPLWQDALRRYLSALLCEDGEQGNG